MAKKIGRNEPCPCGSGKKYKRCCLPLGDKASHKHVLPDIHVQKYPGYTAVYSDLDQRSNRVPELIRQGKLDEAERVCHDLQRRYPDQIDGVERLAAVYEARADAKKAADLYRQAAAFARNAEGFGDEHPRWLLDQAERLDPEHPTDDKS